MIELNSLIRLAWQKKVDMWGIVGIGLILLGVVVLNVLSKMGR
ncbi:hypothetical protein [Moraxella oculi]|uniref:Uncharacterized protein n=1 Tax=Moraxella oculi TaxID=2940516 RepID=A0ABW8U507_9GAMM